jgi:LysM repeat protein
MSRAFAALLLAALAGAAAPVAAPSCDGYRVVRGDTLSRIARRCGSSVAAIARASGVRNPDLILVGQRLVIPGHAPALAHTDRSPGRSDRPFVYRMARGDTLYSLARWSRTRLPLLLAANPGIDPHAIEIGDAVRLPAGAVRPEPARTRERGTPAAAPAPAPQVQEPDYPQPPRREPPRDPVPEPEVESM